MKVTACHTGGILIRTDLSQMDAIIDWNYLHWMERGCCHNTQNRFTLQTPSIYYQSTRCLLCAVYTPIQCSQCIGYYSFAKHPPDWRCPSYVTFCIYALCICHTASAAAGGGVAAAAATDAWLEMDATIAFVLHLSAASPGKRVSHLGEKTNRDTGKHQPYLPSIHPIFRLSIHPLPSISRFLRLFICPVSIPSCMVPSLPIHPSNSSHSLDPSTKKSLCVQFIVFVSSYRFHFKDYLV